jgi:hypothetical protein
MIEGVKVTMWDSPGLKIRKQTKEKETLKDVEETILQRY